MNPKDLVAPLAGAWIEILYASAPVTSYCLSLPSRERGLKFESCLHRFRKIRSLPSRERGLKSDLQEKPH